MHFSGEICCTQFAGISVNVSSMFASRDEGSFYNARSHALFARHSLLKQKGLLVLNITRSLVYNHHCDYTELISCVEFISFKISRRISKFNVAFESL